MPIDSLIQRASGISPIQIRLNNASLHEAELNNANLQYAELNDAWLGAAQLNKANLRRATLNKTHLAAAELNEADLQYAELNDDLAWSGRGPENAPSQIEKCFFILREAWPRFNHMKTHSGGPG